VTDVHTCSNILRSSLCHRQTCTRIASLVTRFTRGISVPDTPRHPKSYLCQTLSSIAVI